MMKNKEEQSIEKKVKRQVDNKKYSLYQILDIFKIQDSYKRYYINLHRDKEAMTKSEWKHLIK